MADELGKVCEHFSLARSCQVCELQREKADLTAKLARAHRALFEAWKSAEKSGLAPHKQAIDEAFETVVRESKKRAKK